MNQLTHSLEIKNLPVGSITPSPQNARTHSRRQVAQIAASIKAFGFNNPILVDAQGMVRAGHGRLEAAKMCGMTTVPAIRLDHMTAADFRAYALADNRLAEEAGWDYEILAIEFQELRLAAPDLDLTLTGFEIPEIDFIVEQEGQDEDLVEEAVEDPTLPPVCRPGDLWILGDHRVYCGNALEPATYQLLLEGQLADAIFTDPPYNVKISGHVSGKGRIQHREFAMASGEMNDEEFKAFLRSCTGLMFTHSKPGSIHFVCMDWRHALPILGVGAELYELKNICVWVKDNGGMGSFYRSQHEFVIVFKNPGKQHQNNVQLGRFGRNRTNVWSYPGANSFSRGGEEGNLLALHPTVKPVQLVADAILDCTAPKDLVLDPFLGSGSTILAAERTHRRCYGVELGPAYVDTAIRRWQRHTGGHAVHASSGVRFDDVPPREAGDVG